MAARLILDTNVALDLLLFDDPSCTNLGRRLADGSAIWLASPNCRAEFLRAASYPAVVRFCTRHGEDRRPAAIAAFDCLSRSTTLALPHRAVPDLPRCADPDDQRLFELAAATGADVLLSKDKAVLAMALPLRRLLPHLTICSPHAWSLSGRTKPVDEADQ